MDLLLLFVGASTLWFFGPSMVRVKVGMDDGLGISYF